jgi:RNA polymerase sigma-70 factor (ECF subfamily)
MEDGDWFDEFYHRALPVVYGYFFRRCGGRKDVAEDLTQETFLSAVRSLDRGVEVEAELPWVVSIARRRLVDYYRREARRRKKRDAVALNELSFSDGSHSLTTVAEARVVAALDHVPSDQRLALMMRYVDGLAVREVAGLLGRSEAATESLIRRGRNALQQAYGEVDVD